MAPKLKDIAEHVGVSAQLVSFYLNHPETTRVKKETRDRIDDAVRKLNYRTNTIGRALSTGKTFTIGLIMGGFAARRRGCYVHALMNEAKKRGYHLLIAITNYDHAEERDALELMISRQVDGIIYTLDLEDGSEIAERIQAVQFPLLLHSPTPRKMFDTVDHDYRESAEALVRFLSERGKKTLFFQTSQPGEVRVHLTAAAQKYGLGLTTICRTRPFDNEEFIRAVLRERPDAILEMDHTAMQEILEAISAEAPEYRPDCLCSYSLPFEYIDHPLMAGYIRRFHEEKAAADIERIIERIENPDMEVRHLLLPTRFLTAEETREFRQEQLSLPAYRQFK